MFLKSLHVKNLRSIHDCQIDIDSLTALVGANGTGKSSFLKALDIFYSTSSIKIDQDDFYDRNITVPIEITAEFHELSDEAKEKFEAYIEDNHLKVTRVLEFSDGKFSDHMHGTRMANPEFTSIRSASKVADKKVAYQELQQQTKYGTLPKWTNQDAVSDALNKWEQEHQDQCSRQLDDGQFFGFKSVGQGYLGKFTRFILIPAVRNASEDATDNKNSVFAELFDLVVRNALADKEEVKKFREETRKGYDEVFDPTKLEEIKQLETSLDTTLKTYAPDTGMQLNWMKGADLQIPLPRADVRVTEDGFSSAVSCAGHGMQRALVLTLLQHLSAARVNGESSSSTSVRMPNLIFAIEEPELYQHPSRQRHLAKILSRLAGGEIPGVAGRTQVIYTTHCPLFVGIDRFEQVRLCKKRVPKESSSAKETCVESANLSQIAETLWEADGKPATKYTETTLRPRLHEFVMTPWVNEGFFACVAVLCEGEGDRAILNATASVNKIDFDREGIAIIPCGGKNSIDRPAAIFRKFHIPTFIIWDGDHGDSEASETDNHRLQRLIEIDTIDWPETTVSDSYTCFKSSCEHTLEEELGATKFNELLEEQARLCGLSKKRARKNPLVLQGIFHKASENGLSTVTFKNIVDKIVEMRRGAQ